MSSKPESLVGERLDSFEEDEEENDSEEKAFD